MIRNGEAGHRRTNCFQLVLLYHPLIICTMKVHVFGERSSFTNVDLVAIQSLEPRAQVVNKMNIISISY